MERSNNNGGGGGGGGGSGGGGGGGGSSPPLSGTLSVCEDLMGRFGKVLGQKGQNVSSLFVPIFSSERSLGVKTHRRLELRALIAGAIRPR